MDAAGPTSMPSAATMATGSQTGRDAAAALPASTWRGTHGFDPVLVDDRAL